MTPKQQVRWLRAALDPFNPKRPSWDHYTVLSHPDPMKADPIGFAETAEEAKKVLMDYYRDKITGTFHATLLTFQLEDWQCDVWIPSRKKERDT